VAFSDFVADPDGNPLATPSGRIELASSTYAEKNDALPIPTARVTAPPVRYPLRLVTPHAFSRVNSENANLEWTRRYGEDLLTVSPADAAARGIGDGDLVRVESENGLITVAARVTDYLRAGVVCLYQGGWYRGEDPAEAPARDATEQPFANLLTSTEPTRPSRGSRTHSTFVQLEPAQRV